jgi:hypothetical protein
MPIISTTVTTPATLVRCDSCGAESAPDANADRAVRVAVRLGWGPTTFGGNVWLCPACVKRRAPTPGA